MAAREAHFSDLIGRTLRDVTGAEPDSERVVFTPTKGFPLAMYHRGECCEYVRLVEVHGDISDIIGSEILVAEEVTNIGEPRPEKAESWTWTFYKLATAKGYVTLRWLGESNGHYSEAVSIWRLEP